MSFLESMYSSARAEDEAHAIYYGWKTSRKLHGVEKFDHSEQCWMLTNYLEEIVTDPQLSFSCSGRASLKKSPHCTQRYSATDGYCYLTLAMTTSSTISSCALDKPIIKGWLSCQLP